MARRVYGQSSAQKKGKYVAATGPHLARGRTEHLVHSASCTPSEEGSAMDEDESTTMPMESVDTYDESSPMSRRLSSTISFSPPAYSPSTSRAQFYASIIAQARDDEIRRDAHAHETQGPRSGASRDNTVLAGLLHTDQANVSYPLRLNEIQQETPSVIQSPTSIGAGSPVTTVFVTNNRRLSETNFRAIARKPPHHRHDGDALDAREQGRVVIGKPKGVKKPYKNQEERDKVKAVRQFGACLRCSIMRQSCEVTEEGEECKNCKVPRRKFNIPCTRAGPATRWKHLFPEIVTSQHDPKIHKAYRIGPNEELPGMFRLPLTHVSNFSVELSVVEDSSIPESDRKKYYFMEEGDPEHGTVQRIHEERCAPLVPVVTSSFTDVASWISKQISDNQSGLFLNLPIRLFPERKEQDWPRDLLYLFQKYHENVYRSKIVRKAFRSLTVRYLMSRRFYIPFNSLRDVNKYLSEDYQETEEDTQERIDKQMCMVPKFVNRYFKSALMFLLRESLKNDFTQLEEIFKLHEKSPGSELTDLDRDEALCYVALMLTIVAIQQIKIMQSAQSQDKDASQDCPFGEQTQTVRQAKEIVQTIETEVIDHILGLYSYKFVRSNRKGQLRQDQTFTAREAREFDLVGRFNDLRNTHRSKLAGYTDLTLNLSDAKLPRFFVDNTTRVLLKFAETMNPTKTKKPQAPN